MLIRYTVTYLKEDGIYLVESVSPNRFVENADLIEAVNEMKKLVIFYICESYFVIPDRIEFVQIKEQNI